MEIRLTITSLRLSLTAYFSRDKLVPVVRTSPVVEQSVEFVHIGAFRLHPHRELFGFKGMAQRLCTVVAASGEGWGTSSDYALDVLFDVSQCATCLTPRTASHEKTLDAVSPSSVSVEKSDVLNLFGF